MKDEPRLEHLTDLHIQELRESSRDWLRQESRLLGYEDILAYALLVNQRAIAAMGYWAIAGEFEAWVFTTPACDHHARAVYKASVFVRDTIFAWDPRVEKLFISCHPSQTQSISISEHLEFEACETQIDHMRFVLERERWEKSKRS